MSRGIPVESGQYVGGSFAWLAPLPVFTRIGPVLGYALLGVGWLVPKSEGALYDCAWLRVSPLGRTVLVVPALATAASFAERDWIIATVFLGRPWGLIFPAIGLLAMVGIVAGARRRRGTWQFAMTVPGMAVQSRGAGYRVTKRAGGGLND